MSLIYRGKAFCVIADAASTTADNQLLYLHELYDILDTSDSSDLSSACISQYSAAWEEKVATMMGSVNQALDEGLCEQDTARVLTYIPTFASLGSQVKRYITSISTMSVFVLQM